MAILHVAELSPSKPEMLAAWLPSQPWFPGSTGPFTVLGTYRFDDPAGEVGIETFLLHTTQGHVVQVPATYRAVPFPAPEGALMATSEHSVLGRRWVYDGAHDPVYGQALARAILTGGTQAALELQTDQGVVHRPATTTVSGTGSTGSAVPTVTTVVARNAGAVTVIESDGLELVVLRIIEADAAASTDTPQLTGLWPGRAVPAFLALARTF